MACGPEPSRPNRRVFLWLVPYFGLLAAAIVQQRRRRDLQRQRYLQSKRDRDRARQRRRPDDD